MNKQVCHNWVPALSHSQEIVYLLKKFQILNEFPKETLSHEPSFPWMREELTLYNLAHTRQTLPVSNNASPRLQLSLLGKKALG